MKKKTTKTMIIPKGTPLPAQFNGPGFKLVDAVPVSKMDEVASKVNERPGVKDTVAYDIPAQGLIYAKPGKKSRKELAIHREFKRLTPSKAKKQRRGRQRMGYGGVTRRK